MKSLEFGFVGGGRRNACSGVSGKVVACVERNRCRALLFRNGLTDERGRGDAKAVIRYGQRVRGTKFGLQFCLKFFVRGFRNRRLRLAVDTKNLLTDGVNPASKEAGFGGSRPPFETEDTGNIDAFGSEIRDERIAGGIVADRADWHHAGTKSGKIIRGIGAAARSKMRFPVAQNQDRSFARDAGDVAKLVFVGYKIAEENNRL